MASISSGGTAYEQLDELYDVWCAEVLEDIPFYLGLAASLAAELGRDALDVVELGAGSGRMSLQLAAAGHRVTAIDASPAQLARLAHHATELGVEPLIAPLPGDMLQLTALVPAESADLVIVPFRGLLHVTADRDTVLRAAAEVLRPGGALAFDVFHPDEDQVADTHGRWIHRRAAPTATGRWRFDERATYTREDGVEPGALRLDVDVRARWRAGGRLRRRAPHAAVDDPSGDRSHERTARLELMLVPAERWRQAIERAGLRIDGAYGWFDARPLAEGDDDSVWVARRP